MRHSYAFIALVLALVNVATESTAAEPIELGARRELFVDDFLIERMQGVRLKLNTPTDEGIVFRFDKPWEGRWGSYCTVIKDGDRFRLYYRGWPEAGDPGVKKVQVVTCMAESSDGIRWRRPKIDAYEVNGSRANNVVLDGPFEVTENFTPMLDTAPGVPNSQRYKGLGGQRSTGLFAYVSPDGIHWRKLQEQPVLPTDRFDFPNSLNVFDSQNVSFWSPTEGQYVCYYRMFKHGLRRIARTCSPDFVTWSDPVLMEYRHRGKEAPIDELYTNQTQPYFRAPHLYVATPARYVPNQQVVSKEEAKAIGQHLDYLKEISDSLLLTSRDYVSYDRTFLEAHLRPGIGPQNWVSRTNYPALNIVQTGPAEMSLYVNQNYGQLSDHLRRYSIRLDGLASVNAGYEEGDFVTKPITFTGTKLLLNFSTSTVGQIRVEIQDASGQPLPGFHLSDSQPMIGNEIEKHVRWSNGTEVSELSEKPVRLRFTLKDADLYALRFE